MVSAVASVRQELGSAGNNTGVDSRSCLLLKILLHCGSVVHGPGVGRYRAHDFPVGVFREKGKSPVDPISQDGDNGM